MEYYQTVCLWCILSFRQHLNNLKNGSVRNRTYNIGKQQIRFYWVCSCEPMESATILKPLSTDLSDFNFNQIKRHVLNLFLTCPQYLTRNQLSWTLALESQTSINKLKAPSAYQRSSKCTKTSKKINFIKIQVALVSISINRDMVLKWKLGQLVWTDLLPLKRISFSSTHRRSIVQWLLYLGI